MRILLVEDEALILMQMEALVEEAGHLVVGTAMRSAEAIDLAHAMRPDIAFVDLSLGDGDSGIVVARALTAVEGVMVMYVTANALRLGRDFAGAAGLIVKPFTRAVMTAGIAYLEECVRRPPPVSALPSGMRMADPFLPAGSSASSNRIGLP